MLFCLIAVACGPREEDTDAEGVPPDTDPTGCANDDACGDGEICEADECVAGDRNDDTDGAEAVLWEDGTDGEINPAGDVDWYAVQAEGGEFVRITVTDEDDGDLDSVVSVYNEAGKRVVWEDEHPAGSVSSADSMCFAYFPEAGTYYIEVEDASTFYGDDPVGGPDSTYTLEVEEWNSVIQETDSAQEAGLDYGELQADTFYSLPVLIDAAGDADWAAFDLPATGAPVYLVALQHAEESDLAPVVTLRNQDGDEVLSSSSPTADAPALLPNPAGTSYVVGVTDGAGAGGADHWTWVFLLVRDPGYGNDAGVEPDDDLASANVLDLEDQQPDSGKWWAGYRQGVVSSPTDTDLYAFDVPFDDAYVTVYLGAQTYGGFLVTRLELLDATGATLDTVDSIAGTDTDALNLGPYPAGAYYLRVSATPESAATGGEGFFYLFGLHATSFLVDE